jgi:hypothetical protein
MYMIQIELEGGPACQFPSSTDYHAAIAVWLYLLDHLKPGRRVLLMNEDGRVVKTADSGDTKKLIGGR